MKIRISRSWFKGYRPRVMVITSKAAFEVRLASASASL
jgi:hypothetical protein